MASFVERAQRRLRAEAWLLDAAKRHPRSRQLRGFVEQRRSQRLVDKAGSVEAALDLVVQRAIDRAAPDRGRP